MNHLKQLVVYRILCDLLIVCPGQLFISGCRIEADIIKGRQFHRHSSMRFRTVHVREHLTEQVVDLRIGGTGEMHIRQSQTCSNRFGTFRLTCTCRSAHHEVAHGLGGSGGCLSVTADLHDLLWDHIPPGNRRDLRLFFGIEFALGKGVFSHKVFRLGINRNTDGSSTCLEDLKIAEKDR